MGVEAKNWLHASWSAPVAALLFLTRSPCLIALGLIVVAFCAYSVFSALTRRAMSRWATAMGCSAVDPTSHEWPWQSLHLRGTSRVVQAWSGDIEGLPVTFGEVTWSDGAFGGAVVDRFGRGTFVVVGLAQTQPPMAARLPYTFIGDSPRLEQPALRHAFRIMEIPPFTVRDTVLFTVEPRQSGFEPGEVYRAVRRALHVVRLLDVGPDRPLAPAG
ncbi:hypothetical protein [Actinoplanes sp. M2I2]|uniref:hypothetical protein n=1 Tax=Actinoplanes sp. M2I2 TaxID=1734444 RepID=UPI0020224BF6|nr:hypothetical protein [Actinoplanes sp. M2I2]